MYIRSFEDGMWLLEWWKVICALTKVSPSLSFVFTEQLRIPTECSLLEWKEMVSRNLFFLFMCLHQAWRWNLAIWMAEHDCGPVYASLFSFLFFNHLFPFFEPFGGQTAICLHDEKMSDDPWKYLICRFAWYVQSPEDRTGLSVVVWLAVGSVRWAAFFFKPTDGWMLKQRKFCSSSVCHL